MARGNPKLAEARKNRKPKIDRFKLSLNQQSWVEIDNFNLILMQKINKLNGEGSYILSQGFFNSFNQLGKIAKEKQIITEKECELFLSQTKNISVYFVDGFIKIKQA